ncbi:MAG: ISL3 family transposase [Anaerolineales bacterium]|nr:ISL3 family transposase [Anaerolineales bacterium]
MIETLLLANPEVLQIKRIEIDDQTITLEVSSTQSQSACPSCQQMSVRVHSKYMRKPVDLPCAGLPVHMNLYVQRFFCDNRSCKQLTFTERLPEVIVPFARRTKRMAEAQRSIGFSIGGEAGARIAKKLAMPTSPDTILRLVRSTIEAGAKTPKVLGIDDWAIRKGSSYGTILVDLENRRPVDLLPNRTTETLVMWLKEHPGIEIISRDRANAYAEAVKQGAPEVIEVADRFHLMQNVREVLERFLDRHPALLHTAKRAIEASEQENESQDSQLPEETPRKLTKTEQKRQSTRQRRMMRYEEVIRLKAQGYSMRTSAKMLGISRMTIARYLRADSFVEMSQRKKMPSALGSFEDYIQQRWDEGCHNGSEIFREICTLGFKGSRSSMARCVAKLRQSLPRISKRQRRADNRPLSTRQAAWLLIRKRDDLKANQLTVLDRLLQGSTDIQLAYSLSQDFVKMIHDRKKRP